MSANVLLLAKLLTMIVSSVRTTAGTAGGELIPILRLVEFGSSGLGLSLGGGDSGRAMGLIVRELIRVTE
jgi:hypothetical protein